MLLHFCLTGGGRQKARMEEVILKDVEVTHELFALIIIITIDTLCV